MAAERLRKTLLEMNTEIERLTYERNKAQAEVKRLLHVVDVLLRENEALEEDLEPCAPCIPRRQ